MIKLNYLLQIVFILFVLLLPSFNVNAQEVHVIDGKGTIQTVINNQVTTSSTAPTNPLEGDMWFNNTDPNNILVNVWDDDASHWLPISNDWLGNRTIHHTTVTPLAITEALHNNADIHVENTGVLTITATDVSDAMNFYITNTTTEDNTLSFTGFQGAFLRNGGNIINLTAVGLTLKANTRYLAHITENVGVFFFNATEAQPYVSAVPLWESDTDGGGYLLNDIINHNGVLYKNLTGTNLNTTPELDITNWRPVVEEEIRPTIPILDNFVFKGYTAHKSTGLPQDQGWTGAQLGTPAYFRVLNDGIYDIGGFEATDQPYLNLRDRGNLNPQMLQTLDANDIDTALDTDGGFTLSFYGRMNPTSDNNKTLSLLLEWTTDITFSANTKRIFVVLYKDATGQYFNRNAAANNDIKVAELDEYVDILLRVKTDGSADVYLNGVEQAVGIPSVLHNTPGRGDQFTLESGNNNGEGEEANIIQYGGYFATTNVEPNKITLTNATGLDSKNISIDYLPNANDREIVFDLDNAPVGATITVNPRHVSRVVRLTRVNTSVTFNGYSAYTKVSSIPFVITCLGNGRWVL